MNTFIKNLIIKVTIFSAIFAFGVSIKAQKKPASNSNTNTESTTPTIVPTPIPIGNVVTEAEATSKKLEKIRNGIKSSPSVDVIEAELPKLKDELDLRVMDTNKLLAVGPSLETLRTVEQDWSALSKTIPAWKDDLKSQITVLDNYLKELDTLKKQWQETLELIVDPATETQSNSNTNSNTTSNTNAEIPTSETTEVPAEILEKIRVEIKEIENTQKQLEEKRSQLLTLQTRVGKEETRIKDTLLAIKKYREEALTNLFIQDSPAIWNAHRSTDSIGGLSSEAGNTYATQINALSEYTVRQREGFVIHGLLFILFVGILFWARKRLRPMVEEDTELEPAFKAFKMPFVGALILTIMLSSWFYPQAPRMLSAILGGAALIPGIIYLRTILEKPLFPILNALMVFYFIDQLRQITATLPLLSRILFLAEMIGVIIFLVWFLRSKRFANKIEVKHQRIFVVIKKVIPYLLGFFSIALIANILGFVSLSNVIGNSILVSAYIALILYAAIQIIKSLLIFALRIPPLSKLGMVKTHREIIKDKFFKILKWWGIIFWAILTLNLFSIRETLFNFLKGWLTAELVIGSIAISLSDVIVFGFAIWLTFALSRLIRFILAEDVYTRVNLGGGVSYAISTVLHYVILVFGFIFALATLGIDLTKFTILAGAVGVGLGFGLQNIVNNFVSGLILLFERPVKVNDVVQIGANQGELKQIGLRASVLKTPDGAEVIVPNGELISKEVTNWTLSNQQRRLDINVGVAYGNKPREILEMLTKVAKDNDDIMQEPAPRTIFVGFGDNSLDFQLRAWTDSDQWVVIKSELTLAVHDVLEAGEIEIPFPQRDLHIRDVDKEFIKQMQSRNE